MARKQDYVYRQLWQKIISGQYAYGTRLPNEVKLSEELNVSRVTLRLAMSRMVSEGALRRSTFRGDGTIVTFQPKIEKRILIIIPEPIDIEISNPANYLLPGIKAGCDRLGWKYDILTPKFLRYSKLDQPGVIGIILTVNNLYGSQPWRKCISRLNLPIVQVHGVFHDYHIMNCACIMNDYTETWRMGIDYLAGQGHRRIAFLTADRTIAFRRWHLSETEMLKYMKKKGLDTDWPVIYRPFPDKFTQTARKIFSLPRPPTAVFCYSDYYAMKLYEALNDLKLKIPQDVAILGVGGIPGADYLNPPLTTIDLEYERQGELAVELLSLHSQWENNDRKPLIYSSAHIIPQKSTNKYIFNFKENS